MANFNKVIIYKGFKYKNCNGFQWEAQSRHALNNISQSNALSRLRVALKSIANSLQILYLKPLQGITLLKLAIRS